MKIFIAGPREINELDEIQNDKIFHLESVTSGVGGYLNSYDFGTATPTQDELTQYAMQDIGIDNPNEIFNGTKVINLFDDVAHKFYIEQPNIPECYHEQLRTLVRQVSDCAENMAISSRAFFRDLSTLRDYSQKVFLLEHQSDKTSAKLRKSVFDSDLELAQKIQINNFVEEVADIADLAEDCIDALLIFAIKREI